MFARPSAGRTHAPELAAWGGACTFPSWLTVGLVSRRRLSRAMLALAAGGRASPLLQLEKEVRLRERLCSAVPTSFAVVPLR